MSMTFGSLFAGIGGFDLGFERAGMRCEWQVEINDFCRRVLAKHWPEVKRYGDIRECGAGNLAPVDVICGGFPCQPHSLAGKRRGAADDRDLWPEYRRVIAELRPRYVVGENVPGIRTTILDQVLSDLDGLDYATGTIVVPACAFDAPHIRERVFVLAYAERSEWRSGEPAGNVANREAAGWVEAAGWPGASSQNGWAGHVAAAGGAGFSQSKREREYAGPTTQRDWWAVEPELGGTPNGVPKWLDRHIGRGMNYAESRRANKILRELWCADVSAALWQQARGLDRIQQAEVLFSFVRQYEKDPDQARLFVEGAQASARTLRGLRDGGEVAGAPHQSGQVGQPAGEYSDALQMVSRFSALDSEAQWLAHSWEDGAPRVASKIPGRVDRLRALGNAVVPQVTEWIGRMIAEVEAQP